MPGSMIIVKCTWSNLAVGILMKICKSESYQGFFIFFADARELIRQRVIIAMKRPEVRQKCKEHAKFRPKHTEEEKVRNIYLKISSIAKFIDITNMILSLVTNRYATIVLRYGRLLTG